MRAGEEGILGAALLAGIAVGRYADHLEAVEAAVREEHSIEADLENSEAYRDARIRLNNAYRRLS
jgi:sugar (pentulose or hexulose) kinase